MTKFILNIGTDMIFSLYLNLLYCHYIEFLICIIVTGFQVTMMQDMIVQSNEDREEQNYNYNWVNEVVRCEGRVTAVSGCHSPSYMIIRPRNTRKDPALLSK